MPNQVLLIDDDPAFLRILSRVLEDEGFTAHTASSGKAGIAAAEKTRPQLIILDLVMPGLKGTEVCRALKERQETAHIPILILTANDHDGLEVTCLDLGADDYLTKPAKAERLLARCRALIRRSGKGPRGEDVLRIGDLELDYPNKVVQLKKKQFPNLTPKEFELLYVLASRSPNPCDRGELYRLVWECDPPSELSLKTVEVHVRRIRLKLALKNDHWLATVPGRGYRLVPPA